MTTPERFRRRQLIEGTVLVILGVFSLCYVAYDKHQSDVRDACVAESFHEFSKSITVRSNLAVRTDAIKVKGENLQDRADLLQGQKLADTERLIQNVFAATTTDESLRAFALYQRTLDRIERDQSRLDRRQDRLLQQADRVTKLREKTHIPPFPTGKCG